MRKLRFVLLGAALLGTALFSVLAGAQTTYRWVDPATGLTVFSDQAPPPNAKQVVRVGSGEGAGGEAQLPYATRQAAQNFPVMLYTSATCVETCQQARALLNGRGVPFTEKILSTQEDSNELTSKLKSEAGVPSLFVGQQSFKGYDIAAWNNLLDLAGYPKTAPYGSKPSGAFAK
jgi:glutaredoxin